MPTQGRSRSRPARPAPAVGRALRAAGRRRAAPGPAPDSAGPGRLPGVIGAARVHLLGGERLEAVVRPGQMRIDIGAGNQEAARRQVAVGERATFATEFAVLASGDGGAIALRGKALDDRLGCTTLIGLLRGGPCPVPLQAAFTVQEEVCRRGAPRAGY